MKSDVEIAQEAQMKPITEVAEQLAIPADELELYGKYKAKLSLDTWRRVQDRPNGKLVLVSLNNQWSDRIYQTVIVREVLFQKVENHITRTCQI